MQSELKKGEVIAEVVCAGPKNYAYKTYDSATGESKTVCKVRGITINYSASQLANSENIKDMILSKKEDDETVIVRTENKIKRNKVDGGVHLISEREDKTHSVVFKATKSQRQYVTSVRVYKREVNAEIGHLHGRRHQI